LGRLPLAQLHQLGNFLLQELDLALPELLPLPSARAATVVA